MRSSIEIPRELKSLQNVSNFIQKGRRGGEYFRSINNNRFVSVVKDPSGNLTERFVPSISQLLSAPPLRSLTKGFRAFLAYIATGLNPPASPGSSLATTMTRKSLT